MRFIRLFLLRMKAHIAVSSMMFLLVFFCFVCFVKNVYSLKGMTGKNMTGCIECHTDEKKIKSLYVPPKIEFKEEEGEG